MVEWSGAMSVGHRGVDDQHRDLIARVAVLSAALADASPGDAAAAERIAVLAAEFLSAYKAHAAFEEQTMRQFGFGNVERHAGHHAMHADAIATLLLSEPVVEAIRINLPFITSTVVDHIERDDRDFGAHLKALGLYGQV